MYVHIFRQRVPHCDAAKRGGFTRPRTSVPRSTRAQGRRLKRDRTRANTTREGNARVCVSKRVHTVVCTSYGILEYTREYSGWLVRLLSHKNSPPASSTYFSSSLFGPFISGLCFSRPLSLSFFLACSLPFSFLPSVFFSFFGFGSVPSFLSTGKRGMLHRA